MIFIYFDASALIKRYSSETGTQQVNAFYSRVPARRMVCSGISIGEAVSVLVRKHNDGRLNDRDFAAALTEFRREVIDEPDFMYLPVSNQDIVASLSYIQQHNLNATDAIILRSAYQLSSALRESDYQLILLTSDKRLARAASAESMVCVDPEVATMAEVEALLRQP